MTGKLQKGQVLFGRYRVLESFVDGGMANLYLAEVLEGAQTGGGAGGYVVLKTLRAFLSFDLEMRQMFHDEMELMRHLSHPNIVRWLDAGEHRGSSILVLEYVCGSDLSNLTRALLEVGERLPLELVVGIVGRLLHALVYLHEVNGLDGRPLGLVHRDISPPNVLVGLDGSVKLTDFGVAYHQMMSRESSGEDIRGKFSYISPEMLSGRKVDHRADLFSWGIIFWELCTGRKLFWGESAEDILQEISDKEIPGVRAMCPEIPLEVEQLLCRVLVREPSERYQSAVEVLEEFVRCCPSVATSGHFPALREFLSARPSLKLPNWSGEAHEVLSQHMPVGFDRVREGASSLEQPTSENHE